jgi:hypothetical protein
MFIHQAVNARGANNPMLDYEPDDSSMELVDPSEVTVDVDHSEVIDAVEAIDGQIDDLTERLKRIERQNETRRT